MLANDSHIWCPECMAVRPLLRDFMPATPPVSQHAATDLLCLECRFIVATIHHREPKL